MRGRFTIGFGQGLLAVLGIFFTAQAISLTFFPSKNEKSENTRMYVTKTYFETEDINGDGIKDKYVLRDYRDENDFSLWQTQKPIYGARSTDGAISYPEESK